MKKTIGSSIVIGIAILVSVGFSSTADALTISPARLEINADPGQTITGEFSLINEQEETKTFYSSSANFEAQGDTGTPNFTTSDEGLASWVSLVPEVVLRKGQMQKIPFTITVPKDADAGGHFAAIFLSTVPNSTDKGQVSIGAKIGVLVLLRVSGDIQEGGGITTFDTKGKSSFFTSLPVLFTYNFSNSGGDRVNPAGDLVITNTIGLEAYRVSANATQGNVLPSGTRRFEVLWGSDLPKQYGFFAAAAHQWNDFAFGRYTANLDLTYGLNGKAAASKVVYVLPWQLLVIITVGLLIALLVFSQVLKRYNTWIIAKAREAR